MENTTTCKYMSFDELLNGYETGEIQRTMTLCVKNYDVYCEKTGQKLFHDRVPECDLMYNALELLGIPIMKMNFV